MQPKTLFAWSTGDSFAVKLEQTQEKPDLFRIVFGVSAQNGLTRDRAAAELGKKIMFALHSTGQIE